MECFAKIVNGFQPFTVFLQNLQQRCFTGFQAHPYVCSHSMISHQRKTSNSLFSILLKNPLRISYFIYIAQRNVNQNTFSTEFQFNSLGQNLVLILTSKNECLALWVKTYGKTSSTIFWCCPVLLNLFTFPNTSRRRLQFIDLLRSAFFLAVLYLRPLVPRTLFLLCQDQP